MDGVQRLSAGDLSARVDVKSRDEFGRLGVAFNQMAENVATHERLVVEQERMRRELELCRLIQNEMLPHHALRLGLAEVKGVSIPAREVGGDFFNYFALPGGEVALLVGDVSGKGVSAALLMANVQATLRARLPLEQDLARLADMLDRDLEQNTPLEVYLTLFVGIVDTVRRELRYVNAGHNPQFVLRTSGGFERLDSTGRPLGLLAGAGYEEVRLPLDEGDILFFYTDGMVDAENERGDFLGAERLEGALASSPRSDVDSVLLHVESTVRAFRGNAELSDDATMMALRFGARQLPVLV
jgi:sigma-B regulation protein RsbU (phosphoserine phosphatase)